MNAKHKLHSTVFRTMSGSTLFTRVFDFPNGDSVALSNTLFFSRVEIVHTGKLTYIPLSLRGARYMTRELDEGCAYPV